jgi:hypothetical protein
VTKKTQRGGVRRSDPGTDGAGQLGSAQSGSRGRYSVGIECVDDLTEQTESAVSGVTPPHAQLGGGGGGGSRVSNAARALTRGGGGGDGGGGGGRGRS